MPSFSELPEAVRRRPYYHGTRLESVARSILSDGVIKGRPKSGRDMLAPVAGRVYVTSSLEYATIYVLGGVMQGYSLGDRMLRTDGRFGYLFVTDNASFGDVQPDEDWVGQRVAEGAEPVLADMVARHYSRGYVRRMTDGEYAYQSRAGKWLLKVMSWSTVRRLSALSPELAVAEPVRFTSAWRFDKTLSPQLRKDGSNFFDLAERVR